MFLFVDIKSQHIVIGEKVFFCVKFQNNGYSLSQRGVRNTEGEFSTHDKILKVTVWTL